MTYTEVCRRGLHKRAAGEIAGLIGSGAYLLGALVVANLAAQGVAAGYLTSAAGSPGAYDMQNLEKQHRLARLNRDNQTQRILQQRQAVHGKLKAPAAKSMRIA